MRSSNNTTSFSSTAAIKIQSLYRAHAIRKLYKQISAANRDATQLQNLIQQQDTVDTIRSQEREKLRINEALMSLLLKLDSVPGYDPAVREARRKVSRRIVGLQEILDGIVEAKADYCCDDNLLWGPSGEFRNWDGVVGDMEEELCRDVGGDDLDKFCAQYLGFRCFQRFLRD
ncbi:hypothetical protein ACFE04_031208 [Oxalis oulophora]